MQLDGSHDNYMKMIDSLTFRHGYINQGCLGITLFLAEEKKVHKRGPFAIVKFLIYFANSFAQNCISQMRTHKPS